MKKTIILFTLIFIAILFVWYSNHNTAKETNTLTKTSTVDLPKLQHLLPSTVPDKNRINSNIEETYLKNQSYAIFEELDIDDVPIDIKPIENVKPIAALHMKKDTIKEIEIGDTILLPSIEGNVYELTITNKTVSARGNISIDGEFSENGIRYSSILTEGSSTAFISMNTPEGTYEIEVFNGIGYIYISSDIEKEKIDHSQSDAILHKEEHH